MGFWSRLTKTFRRQRHNAEIDEELQFHLEMKAREGRRPREARLRFGNPMKIREETRDAGILEWLDSLVQDARYGLRQMRRTPALTVTIVLSLAIGIGANAAIFGIVDASLIKRLPVRDPGSLVLINWTASDWPDPLMDWHSGSFNRSPDGRVQGTSVSPALHRKLAHEQSFVESLIGFSDLSDVNVAAAGRAAEQISLQYVSANYFRDLGVPLRMGRGFGDEDDRVGQEPVVIISHRYWQREFAGRPDVLEQPLRINNVPARIVGVAPAAFFGLQIGDWVDLYAPLAAKSAFRPRADKNAPAGESEKDWWVRQMARLKPGASATVTQEQLSALFQRIAVPDGVKMDAANVPSLAIAPGARGFETIGGDDERALRILLLLAGLVLLIVCANVANLLLSRAVVRQRESAVRLVLGAPRLRILRQQMVESSVFALAGGTIGLLLGNLLAESLHALLKAGMGFGGFDLGMDVRIAGYTAAISLLTAFMFGIAPAFRSSRCLDSRQPGRAHSAHDCPAR